MLNEAELLSPIEDMVAGIERRMEHAYGVCQPDCRQCSLERCEDCDKVEIWSAESAQPLRTIVTRFCASHR